MTEIQLNCSLKTFNDNCVSLCAGFKNSSKLINFFNMMLPISPNILMTYLIMFADTLLGQLYDYEIVECRKQKTYAIAKEIEPPLTLTLYYQAGRELFPDIEYLQSVCLVMNTFPEVNFNLIVGQAVTKGKKGPECFPVGKKKDTSCEFNYEHVCASQLVNFNIWVCCTVCGISGAECIEAQDESKVNEFLQCVQLQDENIKADEILLNNAKEAEEMPNPYNAKPLLLFNGKNDDMCARFMFASKEDPIRVIKALLNGGQ